MITEQFRKDYNKRYDELAKPGDDAHTMGRNHDKAIEYARQQEKLRNEPR